MQFKSVARDGAIGGKIVARERCANFFQISRKFPPDITAIKILKPGMRELVERVRQFFGSPDRALFRKFPLDEKARGKSRRSFQHFEFERFAMRFGARLRITLASEMDGVLQQIGERQAPAKRLRKFMRKRPSTNSARDGQCRERPSRRDRVVAEPTIIADRRVAAGKAAGLNVAHA